MDINRNNMDFGHQAWIAFQECSSALLKEQLAFELRPRFRDEKDVFSGDYDYLADFSRFEEIVQLFFRVCLEHAVSFQVRRRWVFKHQIVLFGSNSQKIIFEFWPHAELTTGSHRKGSSFLTYQRFDVACKAGLKEETLALLFVCHLFFKRKDLSSSQVQWRLKYFVRMVGCGADEVGRESSFSEEVKGLLLGIIRKNFTLSEANQMSIDLLGSKKIQVSGSGVAKWSYLQAKACRFFRGWGGRVVPCVGPDGSGKTYFIAAVMNVVHERSLNVISIRFKSLFRKNKIYAHLNKRYRKQRDIPRNVADERLAPFLYAVALPAYGWQILKSLNRTSVLMDRFFLEFMVRGYRENTDQEINQMRGYLLLSRLIPGPRKMIILTADEELISSRKEEMSSVAIQDFYNRYISFSINRKIANVIFLNTSRSGPELAECCLHSLGVEEHINK